MEEKLEKFDSKEDSQYRRIYGAVAWPGKRPGFAVIVGQTQTWRLGGFDMVFLDEIEDENLHHLVRRCGVLDFRYQPEMWIGDWKNPAADRFIQEMNAEFADSQSVKLGRRQFALKGSLILEMKENMFAYLFPILKSLLDKDHRRLFIREDSKLREYMAQPQPGEIADFKQGDWPAIEALGLAVCELEAQTKRSMGLPKPLMVIKTQSFFLGTSR